MASSSSSTEESYPLHRLVWGNRYRELDDALARKAHDAEARDPRGRTPLMLAVTLGHLESTRVLLRRGADVNVVNRGGWNAVQEAVATGDPELLQMVLERRDRQRYSSRVGGIPELLAKLKSAPDFYVEMKWEFTSWVPFLSRVCPSDTYRVYKRGSSVRIDTTLLGFEQTHWVRGSRSYVFSGREDGADLYEVDHDTRTVYCEEMRLLSLEEMAEAHAQSEEQISARLTTPLVLTFLDTDKINFERSRGGGFWGWGASDRSETVNGYESKVFGAHNVEVVTKTRTEHLTEEDKKRAKSTKNPLQSFLGMAETEVKQAVGAAASAAKASEFYSANNPCCISPDEYFGEEELGEGRDIGRPKELTRRVQKFQAQLWLCEEFPLSLQEQVMPIVDLMAISNAHFQKLKDFITCSFPAGFPVKIEIPLFHVVNARVTFGNIFGLSKPVDGITVVREDASSPDADDCRLSCALDDSVFAIPSGYSRVGGQSSNQTRRQYEDDDDQLLQYALRQSMSNEGNGGGIAGRVPDSVAREEVDIWEALQAQAPSAGQPPRAALPPLSAGNGSAVRSHGAAVSAAAGGDMDINVQRAIELSLKASQAGSGGNDDKHGDKDGDASGKAETNSAPDDLGEAIRRSQQEQAESARRQQEEDEILKRVLELSLQEK